MPATWIILVNWNGGADTVECLESLLRLEDADFAVAVVDNGSVDGTADRLAAWAQAPAPPRPTGPPWNRLAADRRHAADLAVVDASDIDAPLPPPGARITLLTAGRNLGFAAANNLGMRFAGADAAARFYWLLNNDTVVAADSLTIQRRRLELDPTTGMLGSRLMFYDAPDVVQGVAGGYHRWRARGFHLGSGLGAAALPPASEVEAAMAYVLGASMLVRRTLVDRIGGMSERYFLYFEELDWAARLPDGVRLGTCYGSVVYHKEGGSIGSSTRARPSETSLYYLSVNLMRFAWHHDPLSLPFTTMRLLRDAVGHGARRDGRAARAVLRGLADAIRKVRRRGPFGSPEFENA